MAQIVQYHDKVMLSSRTALRDNIGRTTVFFQRNLRLISRSCEFTNAVRFKSSTRCYYSTSSSSSSSHGKNNGNHKTNSSNTPLITGTIPAGGQGVALHQTAQIERCFTQEQVRAFGLLVGDENPLHIIVGKDTALRHHPLLLRSTHRNENENPIVVVHGMLVASLFTSIFGTLIPGAVYLEQSLQFVRPVYVEEFVKGRVSIIDIDETPKRPIASGIVLTCDTTVLRQNKVCIKGKAKVWLVNGYVQPV